MELTRRVLKLRAKPLNFNYPVRNRNLADRLYQMMKQENGIGLAAPQVGMSRRLFVMEINGQRRDCFNPEIIDSSQKFVDYDEGCLSYKGDQCTISRPDEISVRYQNYRGDWYTERLDGLLARCFQHEYDHLEGITMWDRYEEQHAKQS